MTDWISSDYLDKLGQNLEAIQEEVREAGKVIDAVTASDAAVKASYVIASDEVLSLATEVLMEAAIRACIESGEYDYPLYIEKLTGAIAAVNTGLFEFDKNDKSIHINMRQLGHFDQWIAAANKVRLEFQIGESRKAQRPIDGMESALKFWTEKIYKPAREGLPVPEPPPAARLSPETREMGKLLKPKVSADQESKYSKVIQARLDLFSNKEAPFWEVLNNGNMTPGHGGTSAPYPVFPPTNFVEDASRGLTLLFRESMGIYKDKVEDALLKTFTEDIEPSSEYIPLADRKGYVEPVKRRVKRQVAMAELSMTIGEKQEPWKTMDIVKTIDVTYEIYASSLGNIFVRARGPKGQFIKSLLNID